jgi:hypothetical protein
MNKNYLKLFVAVLIFFPVIAYFLGLWIPFYGDYIETKSHEAFPRTCDIGDNHWGFLHWFYTIVCIISYVISAAVLGSKSFPSSYENIKDVELKKPKINYWKILKIAILFFIVVKVCTSIYSFYTDGKIMYNTSIVYKNNLKQKEEARLGYYDNMWKTYMTKNSICLLNKETFIEVTRLMMEARKDGSGLAWKWVQENQNVPYHEFTKFYADLSTFIEDQRKGYYALELECQNIVRQQNILLDSFPNNIYNKVLNIQRLESKYGFLSDSTNKVFKSGVENLK